MVDTGDERHAPSCVELDDRSGSDGLLFMINRDAERFVLAERRLARPDLHRQLAPAADDILLLLSMGMRRSCHSPLGVHQLFAILRLVRQVHEDKPITAPISQSEICDVPARVWRESPAVRPITARGRSEQGVDLATLHRGKIATITESSNQQLSSLHENEAPLQRARDFGPLLPASHSRTFRRAFPRARPGRPPTSAERQSGKPGSKMSPVMVGNSA